MTGCIFCRMIAGEAPASIIHRDEAVIAFKDIIPQAPTHILVVPIRHISSAAELTDGDRDLAGRLIMVAVRIADEAGLRSGYRMVINTGKQAGQSVDHVHIHLLGGRKMGWPPG